VGISPVSNENNSASAVGGIITFGIACFVLIIMILLTIGQIMKVRK